MNIENVLKIISNHYNLNLLELQELINNNLNIKDTETEKKLIILPYYGKIFDNNCKGLVYNHGLYTQCTEKMTYLCSKCIKNKYGTVDDRKKYDLGCYITPNGKKESDYNLIINRLNYNIEDVINEFKINNIDIKKFNIKPTHINTKKGRGRPKKIITTEEENDTIEVIKYLYRQEVYLKTKENILLDYNSYDAVGIINNNGIVELW